MPHDIELPVAMTELNLRIYDSVKAELLQNVKNLSAQLHYAIAISAGLFSWILTHKPAIATISSINTTVLYYIVAGLIPLAVTGLFYKQTLSAFRRIDEASSFVEKIESYSNVGSFEAVINRKESKFREALYWSWSTLLIVDGVMAFVAPALSFVGKA